MTLTNRLLTPLHLNYVLNPSVQSRVKYLAVSRFYFQDKASDQKDSTVNELETSDVDVDEDGDLDVPRKPSKEFVAVTIEHALQTKLEDVGKQVWQGCLLLADYIIDNQSEFSSAIVLDLGAGVGLTSIVAGMFARKVFLTDVGAAILKMAERNVTLNQHLLSERCSVCVRQLDWQQTHPLTPVTDDTNIYHFKETDQSDLQDVTILLAAEVIYDLDLTESFFNTILNLMSSSPKTLYLSLEKRIVFSTHDLDVSSPAYEHFQACLEELVKRSDSQCVFEYTQIACDFPQYFTYVRTNQLELWKIVSKLGKPDA